MEFEATTSTKDVGVAESPGIEHCESVVVQVPLRIPPCGADQTSVVTEVIGAPPSDAGADQFVVTTPLAYDAWM